MDDDDEPRQASVAELAVTKAAAEISARAGQLESESRWMRFCHQAFTVAMILLGASAPALVTITTFQKGVWWSAVAIVATALATAAATIRTVLRFNERYSNSALTSIALLDVEAQVLAKREEVLLTVKPEFKEQKLFEVSAWARKQMFEVMRTYVEKDVSALTRERIELAPPPKVEENQHVDPTRRVRQPSV